MGQNGGENVAYRSFFAKLRIERGQLFAAAAGWGVWPGV
jgi:hypothetical protein